ncbi:hypothetical protein [Synechococcus sp. MIT S1220]|uniref:hypothetical protein n=1 Tax=Synechococcus sp. MIT S1220 TaxID=3082549 RepID=UPI0039AFF509
MTLTLSRTNPASDQREIHVKAALDFFEQARQQAVSGMISEAGSSILKGLAQERRAKATGPQVLQLIKPRS